MKKIIYAVALFLLVSVCVMAQRQTDATKKLSLAAYLISTLYVDEVDEDKLTEDAIRAMLEQLDPHSTYLDPQEVKDMNASLDGNFDGIGIQFTMTNDTLYVIQTVAGGPSEKVGILAGDRIVEINDTVVAGVKMSTQDIMSRLRGKRGTKVNVAVLRKGVAEPIPFRITRDKIPVYSIDASYLVDKHTGYIRLSRFSATSAQEFVEAVTKLRRSGMKNLILDLQGNGGGYLNTAVKIADLLLADDNALIVYTEGRRSPRTEEKSSSKHLFPEGKLVVLVDESSASASEIVSGAIQDWDRGVIVGRRTFGKGLVQRPIPLADGSMIRLTIARYYTPSGRSIQKPYTKGETKTYNEDLVNRYNRGELSHADSIHFPDSLRFNTLKNKRVVYGGGGIMPDYFVPIDTTRYTDYHRDVAAKGLINQEVTSYIDRNRKMLNSTYKDIDKFIAKFEVDEQMIQDLKQLAEKEKIKYDEEEFQKSLPLIKTQLKALVARDLFDTSAYFRIMNSYNDSYQKALEIIASPSEYEQLLNGKQQ